jgi:hypothetical protein
MRHWIMPALCALALGVAAIPGAVAAPATGRATIGSSEAGGGSAAQDVRYVVRCHHVRVWRDTPYGPRRVWVRRCHRVWRNY